VLPLSNLTLVFDSDYNLTTYSETLVTKSDEDKFKFTTYTDGKLVKDEVSDIDYVSDNKIQEELNNIKAQENSGDKQNII